MATDTIYRGGSTRIDSDNLNLTGGLSVDGAATITGALSATAGFGSVVTGNGTAPTLPANVTGYYGSGDKNHEIVLPNAALCAGRMLNIHEAGAGTLTATGYGTQNIGDSGTQKYTPGKYGCYWSNGINWLIVAESV
jgi:hypothetical protein